VTVEGVLLTTLLTVTVVSEPCTVTVDVTHLCPPSVWGPHEEVTVTVVELPGSVTVWVTVWFAPLTVVVGPLTV
jgi:hypothetical protein